MAEAGEGLEQEQEQTTGDEPSEAELTEARALGWLPKDAYKGRPEDWRDARAFLDHGRQVLPIVNARNRKLAEELAQTQAREAALSAEMRRLKAAVEAIEDTQHEDALEEHEQLEQSLKAQLADASREGEHDKVAELTARLAKLEPPAGKPKPKEPELPAIEPAVIDWFKEHPEYAQDKRRLRLGNTITVELRQAGDQRTGRAFLDAVDAEVTAILGPAQNSEHTSKVSGGNGGNGRTGGGGGNGAGKTYADLPKDAKDACESYVKRLVGDGKKYKTADDWRKTYARKYFSQA